MASPPLIYALVVGGGGEEPGVGGETTQSVLEIQLKLPLVVFVFF